MSRVICPSKVSPVVVFDTRTPIATRWLLVPPCTRNTTLLVAATMVGAGEVAMMVPDTSAPFATLVATTEISVTPSAPITGVKSTQQLKASKGVYVTVNEKDAYIKVASIDFGSKGATKFNASLAATAEGTTIELRIDSQTSDVVGTLKVKPTGAIDKWETQSCTVKGARGVHDLYLKFFGNGTPVMNVDWWKFEW